MRINKYLALCGVASRRKCDELILNDEINVNGKICRDFIDIDENVDVVKYKNNIVKMSDSKAYYIFNKPKACVCTNSDDRGRKTIFDYFDEKGERLFCVGRLDYNTTGLLLVTNDGDFANSIMHPSKHISKTYEVVIRGELNAEEIDKLQKGVVIDGARTLPSVVKILDVNNNKSKVSITIFEGRNRQVRKMLESVHKLIVSLDRVRIGELSLGNLKRGEYKKVKLNDLKSCYY